MGSLDALARRVGTADIVDAMGRLQRRTRHAPVSIRVNYPAG